MPIFDYYCPSCNIEVKDVRVQKYDQVVECTCGKRLKKKISASNICGMDNLGRSQKDKK